MTTQVFIVKAETDIVNQIDSLASKLGCSRHELINQAIKECLKNYAKPIEKTAKGMAIADRGEVIIHNEVMNAMEAILQPVAENNFFSCANLWKDREIDQATIRAKAWRN